MEIIIDKKKLREKGLNAEAIERVIKKTIILQLEIIEFNELGIYMNGAKRHIYVKDEKNDIPSLCGDFSNERLPHIIQNFSRFFSKEIMKISKEILCKENKEV